MQIIERGKLGYECIVRRLQNDNIQSDVLSADLEILAAFDNIGIDSAHNPGESGRILRRYIRTGRLDVMRAVATAILYDFEFVDKETRNTIVTLDTRGDEYLSKVVKRIQMKYGLLPNTEENWMETCMRRAVVTEQSGAANILSSNAASQQTN